MLNLSSLGRPRLAYGFWRYRETEIDGAIAMLEKARSLGIDHIDNADIYGGRGGFGGAERLLGQVHARAPSLLQGATIATKAGVEIGSPYNSSREYVTRRAGEPHPPGVERIDLFYIHRPDQLEHPAELAATLDSLAASGKIGAMACRLCTRSRAHAIFRSTAYSYPDRASGVHNAGFSTASWTTRCKSTAVAAFAARGRSTRTPKAGGSCPAALATCSRRSPPARRPPRRPSPSCCVIRTDHADPGNQDPERLAACAALTARARADGGRNSGSEPRPEDAVAPRPRQADEHANAPAIAVKQRCSNGPVMIVGDRHDDEIVKTLVE